MFDFATTCANRSVTGAFAAVLAWAVGASGAVAQEDVLFTVAPLEACMATAEQDMDGQKDCIGAAQVACMEANDLGQTNFGMKICTAEEADWWDMQLNADYQRLQGFAAETDAVETAAPSMQQALKDMQRAWIAYRDAACAFDASQWGSGSGAGLAYASCVLHETAEQVFRLRAAMAFYE